MLQKPGGFRFAHSRTDCWIQMMTFLVHFYYYNVFGQYLISSAVLICTEYNLFCVRCWYIVYIVSTCSGAVCHRRKLQCAHSVNSSELPVCFTGPLFTSHSKSCWAYQNYVKRRVGQITFQSSNQLHEGTVLFLQI